MGISLTLTDQDLPASPAFIDFLHASLIGADHVDAAWYAQEDEGLIRGEGSHGDIQAKADAVAASPEGKTWLLRAYRLFKALLTGDGDTLAALQRFQFYFVIGIPRTGGTYLTKQLFRAAGIDYRGVPQALAHDGFPHLARLRFRKGGNLHTHGLLQLAEYLTMVELFYGHHGRQREQDRIVVPKKFTKALYAFDLLKALLPDNARYLITVRHPLAVCQSVLDKSGGMPADGRFAVRSTIERWALQDWLHWGLAERQVLAMDYLDVLLGYWRRFHLQLAMSGLPAAAGAQVVPYGAEPMTRSAEQLFDRLGVALDPEVFKVAPTPAFDPRSSRQAEEALAQVSASWQALGLDFPQGALAACL